VARIAVIGAGISGMAAAYFLSRKHEVSLFEKEDRLGGHTHTHQIETSRGKRPVDTGFIVYNERTYPNLVRLFHELKIKTFNSDMSFGVSCHQTGFEYSSRGFAGFFADKRNIFRSSHFRLMAEIMRFNRISAASLKTNMLTEMTLGQYANHHRFRSEFLDRYLYPMTSAIWSTSLGDIQKYPAEALLRFFSNHGLLGINTHPQWKAVQGGSHQYIAPLTAPYRKRIDAGVSLATVSRTENGVALKFRDRPPVMFDSVVMACHAPQALALLQKPSELERQVLGALQTSANHIKLHTDSSVLPRRPAARASWNYHLNAGSASATVTYHMNRLQSLDTPEDYLVTLNDTNTVKNGAVLKQMTYDHPLYTAEAMKAQRRWSEISNVDRIHYCGAYWFNGFHEDGLNSALRVARNFGIEW
jgi:predicted NAD/FAD-binding protein